MAYTPGDWSIDRATGNIRYIGGDHDGTGGTPSYATVIEAHRAWQALADDAEWTGDDELDIIDNTPSDRSTDNIITLINGFNIDDTAAEHLYDGSIIQGSGNTETIYDGIVNFGNPSVQIMIMQNGAVLTDDWYNKTIINGAVGAHDGLANASVLTDSGEAWTTDEWVGYTIYNTTDGSRGLITANTGTTITTADGLYGGTDNDWDISDAYIIGVGVNPDSGQGISHRFMVKVRDNGVDIDRRRIVGMNRRYQRTYGEFRINGTSRGNNVLALTDSTDLNNSTDWATIDAIVDITNTEGLRLIDINDDTVSEEYYSEWDRGANSINTLYEYLKHASADGTSETLQGETGEHHRGVTHSVPYDTETGTPTTATNDKHVWGTFVSTGAVTGGPFVVGEVVRHDGGNWKGRVIGVDTVNTSLIVDVESGTVSTTEAITGVTSGATATTDATPAGEEIQNSSGEGKVLAFDDDGATGNFYLQVFKGVAPLNNTRLYDATDHTDYYTCSAAATERTVSTPFVGASTGSALIGAYGLGVQKADTAAADTYFDLSNSPINPPNNVTFTVSGLVIGEDRVLVTNNSGGDIDFTQMATDTTLSGPTETSVSINPAPGIPSDTPSPSGTIRIERDDGLYSRHPYSAVDFATDTFTITSHDFSTNNATSPANVFVTYIDKLATAVDETFSYVYSSDRTHFIRVRDGGGTPIKTAETTGVMGSNGGSATINRITDA